MSRQQQRFERGMCLIARGLWVMAAEHTGRAQEQRIARPNAAGWHDSTAAVAFAAMFAEAFINEMAAYIGMELAPEDATSEMRERLRRAAEVVIEIEGTRGSVTAKYRAFSLMLPGPTLEYGSEPMQGLDTLFRMRNDILHPKPRGTPSYVAPFMDRGMTVDAKDAPVQLAGWFYQIQTPQIAAWACKVTRTTSKHIQHQLSLLRGDNLLEFICGFAGMYWDNLDPDPRVDGPMPLPPMPHPH